MAFRKLIHHERSMSATFSGPTPKEIKREIERTIKGFGFAAVVALTRTAQKIKQEEPRQMERDFDRPKPWTTNAVFLDPATKARPYARVWLKGTESAYSANYDFAAARAAVAGKGYRVSKRMSNNGTPAAKYLQPQIQGGPRVAKGVEVKLRAVGILGPGEYVVPWRVNLDQYGNVPNGLWTKILSDQGAMLDPMSNRAGTAARMGYEALVGIKSQKKRSKYFVATIRGSRAIWERQANRTIVPLLRIVNQAPQYLKRFDFVGVGNRVFNAHFDGELARAVREGYLKAKRVR